MNIIHMKNPITNIYISPAEYSYIIDLSAMEKFKYLVERFDQELNRDLDLSGFFSSIQEVYNIDLTVNDDPDTSHELAPDNPERIDVMIDDEYIMIEANNLSNLKTIIKNFFESGYILRRDKNVEKMFRKSKITKYIRIYSIIGISNSMCLN